MTKTLADHQSSNYTKLLYIGDSGTGKTGSLVSLLKDGYSMKIIDMDNGLETLVQYARKEGCDLSKVEYETIRDKYTTSPAGPIVRTPKAYMRACEVLSKWSETDDPMCVVVVDSLTMLGRAAFQWAKGMNPTAKDGRNWYFAAQQALESNLALLTSEEFRMNVIVISHINYNITYDDKGNEIARKGYTNAIGSALGPLIPDYFNTLILAETIGSGTNVRRKIKTIPTGVIDLKIPLPDADKEYPLETGLSTIFKALKGK